MISNRALGLLSAAAALATAAPAQELRDGESVRESSQPFPGVEPQDADGDPTVWCVRIVDAVDPQMVVPLRDWRTFEPYFAELKAPFAIGAEPRPMCCFIRHRNPVGNRAVKPLFRFVKPTAWTPRNPFDADA